MDAFGRMSVATIRDPEFINITSISPLISRCEIKVLYIGENRNHSYITKEVAIEMAQSLPGTPIVGVWFENKEDFGDHGEQVVIDGEGIKFNNLTKPYGFVAPNAKVWFKEFQDTDEFGNSVLREYLMTEGYLWTEQYEECKRIIDNGNPQSMELDEKTLKGHWSMDANRGVEIFIINDAIFSKLCILGEETEPCFEGASVTAPDVSATFSLDSDFNKSLFNMMQTLKYTLSKENEGGLPMETDVIETPVVEGAEGVENTPVVEEPAQVEGAVSNESTDFSNNQGEVNEGASVENNNNTENAEFAKNEEDKKESEEEDNSDDEDCKKKFELLQQEHEDLQTSYALLEEEVKELRQFKQTIEDAQKDDLIAQFYMLSDEDKKDVIDNKSKYSLDEIEAKLSVICVRKKVSFGLDEDNNNNDAPITYNLNQVEVVDDTPAWIKAIEANRNK